MERKEIFIRRLKELIGDQSVNRIARDMNMKVQTLWRYINGIHEPQLSAVCRIADYFQVTPDYLLGYTDA